MPPSTSPAGVAAPDPTTAGGGLTTPAGQPIDMAALVPVLQQLVTVLQSLAQALQGSGAITAGGAAPTGAMGAPTATAAAGAAQTKGGGHAAMKGGGMSGMPGMDSGTHDGMKIVKRAKPEDRALAQRNLSAVVGSFGARGRAGLDFKNNQTHGYLSQADKTEYQRRNPGLPVPETIVFREGSNVPIGIAFRTNDANFDLGMGNRHDHMGDKGTSQMQHIWFTPDNIDFAFSDVASGLTGPTAARMKKMGYRV